MRTHATNTYIAAQRATINKQQSKWAQHCTCKPAQQAPSITGRVKSVNSAWNKFNIINYAPIVSNLLLGVYVHYTQDLISCTLTGSCTERESERERKWRCASVEARVRGCVKKGKSIDISSCKDVAWAQS